MNSTPLFPGIYSGRVIDINHADHPGQANVAVPSVYGAVGQIAVWARPCFPFGHYYLPEIGDDVWVIFEGGDPNYPVWMGVWYADGKFPAEGSETARVIRSKAGHLIILEDKSGSEMVTVKDKSGNSIEMGSSGIAITASGQNITIKASKVDVQQG